MGAEANKAESPESMIERVKPSVLKINKWAPRTEADPENIHGEGRQYLTQVSSGSGFFVSEEGYFVTNKHCVKGGVKFTVELSTGEMLEARVVVMDAGRDIAILKIDDEKAGRFQPADLGDSNNLKPGSAVYTLGSPHGKRNRPSNGIIAGIPDSKRSFLDLDDADANNTYDSIRETHIDTTASIHPGNSGGPMFNEEGTVIGINTFVEPTISGALNFAIPVNEIKVLIKHPEVFADIYAITAEMQIVRQDENLRLSEAFADTIMAVHGAIRHLPLEEQHAIMSDKGVRKAIREFLKYARTNRSRYTAAYEEIFGVALDDALVAEDTETEDKKAA